MGPWAHGAQGPISGTISEEVFAAEPPTDRHKSLFTGPGGPCMGPKWAHMCPHGPMGPIGASWAHPGPPGFEKHIFLNQI